MCPIILRSIVAGILFFVLSLPNLYAITNRLVGAGKTDCPTIYTRPLHTLVYFASLVGIMHLHNPMVPLIQFAKISIFGAGIFFLMISPDLYQLTHKLGATHGNAFCPSTGSIAVHATLFAAVNWLLMKLHG